MPRAVEIEVPEVTPDFVAFALDADGHAFQRLSLGDEPLSLYPVIDPISAEHALNVEQVLLPAVLELFRGARDGGVFPGFESFWGAVRRAWRGQAVPADEELPEPLPRVLEAVKAEVSELTSEEGLRERAFVRFYQHALCDREEYRRKVRESLERVVMRVNERYESTRESMARGLEEAGFHEEHRDAPDR